MFFYIDIFFFINFLFDFLIIVLSGRLGGVRFSLLRISLSALLGALFACVAVIFYFLCGFFMSFISIPVMSFAAYGYGSCKNFLKQTLILFLGFYICGGATFSLYFYGFSDTSTITVLSAVIFAVAVSFFVSGKIKKGKNNIYAEIYVILDGKEYMLSGLYDSGNLCTDLLTGLPVIIAEDVFKNEDTREGFFDTASGLGKMKVFLPDKVFVRSEGKFYEGKDVAVGVISGKLSADGSFNALIGGICFERLVEKNKNTYKKSFSGR